VICAAVVVGGAMVGGPAIGAAQTTRAIVETTTAATGQSADDTRREFRELLETLPPGVGRVMLVDPTLITNDTYLSTYPALKAYLASHPEVARDPNYFLGHLASSAFQYERGLVAPEVALRREAISQWRGMFDSLLFFSGFLTVLFTLGWLIKYIVDHRRWLRVSRTQADVHAKLIERMTSSEELKGYMDSAAGQQFLQGIMMPSEPVQGRMPVGAPFNRILWSAQAGAVMVALGIGFLVVRRGLEQEIAQIVGAWGTLSIAVGVGFVISAAAAYVISSRLGLLEHGKR
jgi:hypothetical protein